MMNWFFVWKMYFKDNVITGAYWKVAVWRKEVEIRSKKMRER
jgi:hypothetical protein